MRHPPYVPHLVPNSDDGNSDDGNSDDGNSDDGNSDDGNSDEGEGDVDHDLPAVQVVPVGNVADDDSEEDDDSEDEDDEDEDLDEDDGDQIVPKKAPRRMFSLSTKISAIKRLLKRKEQRKTDLTLSKVNKIKQLLRY